MAEPRTFRVLYFSPSEVLFESREQKVVTGGQGLGNTVGAQSLQPFHALKDRVQ